MGPFEVSKEIIARLSDELLRALLGKLIEAEARERGIPPVGIAVGGNQTAADGGVDASIRWYAPPAPGNWLPSCAVLFQCKAERMRAADIRNEMRPKGAARPIFPSLADVAGSYIIFSTDDVTESGYQMRIAAMRAALSDVPDHERITVDFYGADRIARWTNAHVGIALWLLNRSARSLAGWRAFGDWSAPGSAAEPYILDPGDRVTVDGVTVGMEDAIAAIRRRLARAGGAVRLVGISGMGKTRLAEALFDDRIDAGAALPVDNAVYADLGLELGVGAAVLAEQLFGAGVTGVMVLDNCTAQPHRQVAEIVSRQGSRTSLLTVDHDVGSDKPDGTMIVRLGDNGDSVIARLLAQRCPWLGEAERQHLVAFAGGNARIALKIGEGSRDGINIASLDDAGFLDRLFQTGRPQADRVSRDCADSASLVYAFVADRADHEQIEHPVLAGLAGLSPDEFYRQISTFLDFGIAQQRGPQRAIMPPPLANMLAASFIRRADPATLLASFVAGPPRLFASFARRLGDLHEEPKAIALVDSLMGEGGALGHPAKFDHHRRRAFLMAAPANPRRALATLELAVRRPDAAVFTDPANPERKEFGSLLVQLGHDPTLFAPAMEVLLSFVIAEVGRETRHSVAKLLLERFWPMQSATLAALPARLSFIDRLLDDEDERVRLIGVEALDHMIDTHFSSSTDTKFGARALLKEWRPRGTTGYPEWRTAAFDRLVSCSSGDDAIAKRARAVVAQNFRSQLNAGAAAFPIAMMRKVHGSGYWDEGWKAVNETLHFDSAGAEPALAADLVTLEQSLRPAKPEEFFEAFVLGEPWRHWHPSGREKGSTRDVGRLAKRLGEHVVRAGLPLDDLLARATCAQGQNSVYDFGQGLARATRDYDALWDGAYAIYARSPEAERFPALLAGILKGASISSAEWTATKLERATEDPLLLPYLVMLHTGVALDGSTMRRFTRALLSGAITADRFAGLMYGGATKTVPAADLAEFLALLFAADGGTLAALQVLNMRFHGDKSANRPIAPELVALARSFVADPRTFDEDHVRQDHAIASITKVALSGDDSEETARAICRAMLGQRLANNAGYREFDEVYALVMERHPRVVFEEIVGQPVGDSVIARFFGGHARNDDDVNQAKIRVDATVAMEWVAADPGPRSIRLAHFVPYTVDEDGALAWSPIARALIDTAPDPVAVLRQFEQRFWEGSGSGSFSGRFVRRRPLVAAMLYHAERRVRNWAREAGVTLEENIRIWDERDREDGSRFE